MEFLASGAVGLVFVGIVFLILVPITYKMRTKGKSKEQQRSEYYQDYEKRMERYRVDNNRPRNKKKKR